MSTNVHAKRGITERSVYVFNPLPALSDQEILEKAGISELVEAITLPPLAIDWQYSGGFEKEMLCLQPGNVPESRAVLRQSDADVAVRECGERGLVIHALDATPESIHAATVEGLKRAITWYSERGAKRLQVLRKLHSLTAEEMADRKYDYWAFHYNQAVCDLLRAHLNTLAPKRKPAAKPAA